MRRTKRKKKPRSEEEGRAGEHRDKIHKTGKMLSKDYWRTTHSTLVWMSTQPDALSDSSRKPTCKATVCAKSWYKMLILQGLPTCSCFCLVFASVTKLHVKSIGKWDAQKCPKTRQISPEKQRQGGSNLPCTNPSPACLLTAFRTQITPRENSTRNPATDFWQTIRVRETPEVRSFW